MILSDIRTEARRKLDGKWGKAALITLAFFAINFAINFIENLLPDDFNWFFCIINAIIDIPLTFGFIFSLFKLFKDEEVKYLEFLSLGFENFGKSWGITFQIFLKMLLPTILVIFSYILILVGITVYGVALYSTAKYDIYLMLLIVGIILFVVSVIWAVTKSYYYQLSYFVAMDNPEMSAEDAVAESEKLMTGKRGKLFCLQLSFIGWAILASFTAFIGFLWLIPYVYFATMIFYEFVKGNISYSQIDIINDDNPIQE